MSEVENHVWNWIFNSHNWEISVIFNSEDRFSFKCDRLELFLWQGINVRINIKHKNKHNKHKNKHKHNKHDQNTYFKIIYKFLYLCVDNYFSRLHYLLHLVLRQNSLEMAIVFLSSLKFLSHIAFLWFVHNDVWNCIVLTKTYFVY